MPRTNVSSATSTMSEDKVYLRRAYAAHRATIAVNRTILTTKVEVSAAERASAFRWMRLWIACAASYHDHYPATLKQRRLG